MISIITGRRALKPVWLVLAGAGLVAAAGCDKMPLLAPGSSTISLSSSSSIVQANGTAAIRATVLESSGTPVQNGTTVTFTTNLGTISPAEARTLNGVATAQFVANGQSGIAEIHANSGGATSADSTSPTSVSPSIKLTVGGAAVGRIGLTANPTTVGSAGGTSTIVANIVDASGNPLSGVTVSFSTTAGSLSTAVATTDASGNAQTTLTTNKDGTVVTATAGGSSGGTGTTAVTPGTVTIRVNTGPTIPAPTFSPTTPLVGQVVSFSVAATAGTAGTPVQRIVVDFGDGGSATITGSSGGVTRTYTRAGTYSVRATAFDALGDSNSSSVSVPVTAQAKPTVTIVATVGAAGSVTTFAVTATAVAPVTIDNVRVTFGDGSSVDLGGNSTSVQHVYQTSGTYTATVTATDSSGGSASASTVIVIAFSVSVSASKTGNVASFTAIVAPSGTQISSYLWDFGDGNTDTTTGNQTSHTYVSSTSSRTVTVRATAPSGQTATGTASIVVP